MLVNKKNLTSRGCFACIRRKIKCDQRRPWCYMCTRSSRQCPGYRHLEELQFRNTLVLDTNADKVLGASKAARPTPRNCSGNAALGFHPAAHSLRPLCALSGVHQDREAESLYYFRTCAAQDFQGYLRSDFWSCTVFQKSLVYPAIHHALLAVSDAHREWIVNSHMSLSVRTLTQYGKAIRLTMARLKEGKNSHTYILSLYCGILLYYFELLNRNIPAADIHLENSLCLLREWHSSSVYWPPVELIGIERTDFFQLLYTVGRLDMERLLSGKTRKCSKHISKLLRDGLRPIFTGPADAFSLGCLLLLISRSTLQFKTTNVRFAGTCAAEVPHKVLLRQHLLHRRVNAIITMLDEWQTRIDRTSKTGRQKLMAMCTMRLYLISNRVQLADMFTPAGGEVPRAHDEYADEILEYANMAIGFHCTPPPRQGFMPEPGLIAPLKRFADEVSRDGIRSRAYAIIDHLSKV